MALEIILYVVYVFVECCYVVTQDSLLFCISMQMHHILDNSKIIALKNYVH